MSEDIAEWLTVAQAAERLDTTIPRLRRLLARTEMAECSRQEAIPTQRGTRTGTVVIVFQIPKLREALQIGNAAEGVQEQKQTQLTPFSKREAAALELALHQTQMTLAAKDQTIAGQGRELAAKDEIIALLREKIDAMENLQEREQERTVIVSEKPAVAIGETAKEQTQERAVSVPETKPLTLWDRFLGRGRT